ncbi:nuclear transport factor 2 family protein [Sphaerotilus mobilis]|uniref:Ketosteroid isomerase-like protein n=1 Tax=Sphaerotilus mobilis TaxID=47994 RepID=A0A4Q7LB68_9BURK|nr:nuclear transport factor 2 family protein [Sphaerotilus mobilis]RZS46900.1 ketosteroid isomerase-like protein [Sphaerotilus mobilis]
MAVLIGYFEQLSRAELARIDAIYTPDAVFKDPFNEVRGPPAIAAIFGHMFDTMTAPRFIVRDAVVQGDDAFLTWDFVFESTTLRRAPDGSARQCIRGASHLKLDANGRIAVHRDYWDAAEELHEKLPLIGALMRWLRRRLATPSR